MTSFSVPVALVAGALIAAACWRLLSPIFAHPSLERTNVRQRAVPTGGGLMIILAMLAPATAWATWAVLAGGLPTWIPDDAQHGWNTMLIAVLGFGLLGLVDDLLGDQRGDQGSRGFGGHLRALRSGMVTTGALKLFGGGVLSLYLAASLATGTDAVVQVLVDAALIALAANLANLFDRAPGRVTKVALIAGGLLVVAGPTSLHVHESAGVVAPPVATAFVVGAAVGILLPELRERVMLGDTGANAIGAAMGLGAVAAVGEGTRIGVVVVLLAMNLASERVSFSRVIAATPGLRHLDRLGRTTD